MPFKCAEQKPYRRLLKAGLVVALLCASNEACSATSPQGESSQRALLDRDAGQLVTTRNAVARIGSHVLRAQHSSDSQSTTTTIAIPFVLPTSPNRQIQPIDTSPATDTQIRQQVAADLPADGMAALKVLPVVKAKFPTGLFVVATTTGCGAVAQFESIDKGKDVWIQNDIFGKPKNITSIANLDRPIMQYVGDGDTDAAGALSNTPYRIQPRDNIAAIVHAEYQITASVCSILPHDPDTANPYEIVPRSN